MNGQLDSCHCCEALTAQTPAAVKNRPGLSAIAYRVGTHSQFKKSMLAALSDITRPALQNLKTRDNDDFSIALLDAVATAADVLTFYQERIANESYLRTAVERRSVLELAREIGYELSPGVAAETWLPFALETGVGAPPPPHVRAETKIQNVLRLRRAGLASRARQRPRPLRPARQRRERRGVARPDDLADRGRRQRRPPRRAASRDPPQELAHPRATRLRGALRSRRGAGVRAAG